MNANNPQYYAGYQQQQQPTYDQEPYPYQQPEARAERSTNASSIDYNDPNFDVLTPESQIALAHSQLSSAPSFRATGDTFSNPPSYADSVAYSANASQIMAKYPALRKGEVENDVFGSDDESELNDDGDSVCDLSATTHDWNAAAAGRNTRATELRESSESTEDSPFAPGDSSSTAASGRSTQFQGASEFHASEYRPSSAYDKQSFQSHLFSEDGDIDIDRESSLYRDTNATDASYR
ncbi:hypothetical protein BBJ28_00010959 [Nothophytophthora sp. Chile5]|nr:hypothetical protein BBJ28_00010959 [Nothophytophthora sp. Chile5]